MRDGKRRNKKETRKRGQKQQTRKGGQTVARRNGRHRVENGSLHEAARNGHYCEVGRLLRDGARPNVKYSGVTPLFEASRAGHEGCVRALLRVKAKVDTKSLNQAAGNGHLSCVRALLERRCPPKACANAFEHAAMGGHVDVLLLLAKAGEVGAIDSKTKAEALRRAAGEYHTKRNASSPPGGLLDCVKMLVIFGADVAGKAGRKIVHLAEKGKNPALIESLREGQVERMKKLNGLLAKAGLNRDCIRTIFEFS